MTRDPLVALAILGAAAVAAVSSTYAAREARRPVPAPAPANRVPSFVATPSPGEADDRAYVRRTCPDAAPARGTTPFDVAETDLAGRPGAEGFARRRVVSAGTLDVRDGRLWLTGWENLPYVPDAGEAVPRGDLPVSLVQVWDGAFWVPAAVAVRLRDATPVRWVERDDGLGTDTPVVVIAGRAAAMRLALVRTSLDADEEAGDDTFWDTPCSLLSHARGGPSDAITILTGGDGGFPVAYGYDANGRATDLLVSFGHVPWSLLGVPGTPPPAAVSAEPTP